MSDIEKYSTSLINSHMNCANCNKKSRVLLRYNDVGEDGIFWCEKCLKNHEPELYKNHIEEVGDIVKIIVDSKTADQFNL